MKKRDFYVGLVSLALGIILIVMGFFSRSDAGGLLGGLGGGLTGASIGVILRWRTLQSTSQSDFAKHVRRTNIAQQDERSVMLRGRSRVSIVSSSCATCLRCASLGCHES